MAPKGLVFELFLCDMGHSLQPYVPTGARRFDNDGGV